MKFIKSPLNYVGGKYKLLPQIYPHFPKQINTFVDLFGGGANVGINVKANKIIINDVVTDLIELYKALQNLEISETLDYIYKRIDEFKLSLTNEDGFKRLREVYNSKKYPLDFFVLICYSFNHLIRFNTNLEFNSSFGRDRSQYNEAIENNIKDFINVIKSKDIEFTNLSFIDFDFSGLSENDFVYLDPPYIISTASYNDGKRGQATWNKDFEVKLMDILKSLDNRNIKFGLSNVLEHLGNENKILKDWINDNNFYVTYINADYSNSSSTLKDKTSKSVEVFVTNYETFKKPTLF